MGFAQAIVGRNICIWLDPDGRDRCESSKRPWSSQGDAQQLDQRAVRFSLPQRVPVLRSAMRPDPLVKSALRQAPCGPTARWVRGASYIQRKAGPAIGPGRSLATQSILAVPCAPCAPRGLRSSPGVVAEREDPARIDVITKRQYEWRKAGLGLSREISRLGHRCRSS